MKTDLRTVRPEGKGSPENRGAEKIPVSDNIVVRIYRFYRDGFRSMTVGKVLWTIIIAKLLILFAVVKLFFFPNVLKSNFDTDLQRAEHVAEELAMPVKQD